MPLSIFVTPLNSYPPTCIDITCQPFDDLQYAFNYGVAQANYMNDNQLNFFLINDPNTIIPFSLRSEATGYMAKTALFDDFQGQITIQGIIITNPLTYEYKLSQAAILLKTENIYFVVHGSLNMNYIAVLGLDMHIEFIPCQLRPNPTYCTCGSQEVLFDENSVCSIKKNYVPSNENIYNGFIQLVGNLNPSLILFNFGLTNFNSFIYHVTFIYSSSANSSISISQMAVQQAYLPKSFILSDYINGNISILIDSLTMANINDYLVSDFRTDITFMFNLKYTLAFISINSLQINIIYKNKRGIFFFDKCRVFFKLENFELKSSQANSQELISSQLFCCIKAYPNTLNTSMILLNITNFNINDKVILLDTQSFSHLILQNGILEIANIYYVGDHSTFVSENVIWYGGELDFGIFLDASFNSSIIINNSVIVRTCYTFISINGDTGNSTISLYNVKFYIVIQNLFSDHSSHSQEYKNYWSMEEIYLNFFLGVASLFKFSMNIDFKLKNSYFENFQSENPIGTFMALIGEGNYVYLDQVTINRIYSTGYAALFAFGQSTQILINNSNFSSISCLNGNFLFQESKIEIFNSEFHDLKAKLGSLMFFSSSEINFKNVTIDSMNTEDEGLFYGDTSLLNIENCSFINLTGRSANIMSIRKSNITLSNIQIKDSIYYEGNLIHISFCFLNMTDIQGYNLSEGIFMLGEFNNQIYVSNSKFFGLNFEKNGLISVKNKNIIDIKNVTIYDVTTNSNGAILNVNENNNITMTNIELFGIISKISGCFFISYSSSFEVINSKFSNISCNVAGGVILINSAKASITNTTFSQCTSPVGGIIYSKISDINFLECNFINSNTSLIYGQDSSIKITKCGFFENINIIIELINNPANIKNFSMVDTVLSKNGDGSPYSQLIILTGIASLDLKNLRFNNLLAENVILIENCNLNVENILFENNSFYQLLTIRNTEKMKFTINFYNLSFENMLIQENLLEINGDFSFSLKNILLNFNKKLINQRNLIEISNAKGEILNMSINYNLANSQSISDIFIFSIYSSDIVLTNIFSNSNSFQMIYSLDSYAKISSLISYNNTISKFLEFESSTFYLNDTIISDNNLIITENCWLQKNLTTIEASSSNLIFYNVSFINLQIDPLKNKSLIDFKQYQIVSVGGNILDLEKSYFWNSYSYSLFVANVANVKINNCVFELNADEKSKGYKGLIYFKGALVINILNSIFKNLGSFYSGSPVYIDNSQLMLFEKTSIVIKNTLFESNKAISGGAVTLMGNTILNFEDSTFQRNEASNTSIYPGLGGSLFSYCSTPNLCEIYMKNTSFKENSADFGGGFYLENYNISEMADVTFAQSFSKLLNSSSNAYMTNPFYINISKVYLINSQKLIPYDFYLDNTTRKETIEINSREEIQMIFNVTDMEHKLCTYEFSSVISLHAFSPTITMKGQNGFFENGTIKFSRFSIEGYLNESYDILLEMKGRFNIQKNFTIKIRECSIGEYYDATTSKCTFCPYDTYSFIKPPIIERNPEIQQGISVCKKCPENAICSGKTIAPKQDYWMNSSNFTTQVVKCPLPGTCIFEPLERYSSPVKCFEGYSGPLCILCNEGYTKENYDSYCKICNLSVEEVFILIGKLLFIFAFVSHQVYSTLNKFTKDSQSTNVIVKIVRDHFNQIFLISSFCSVFKLDDSFMDFYNTCNEIVTGSAINFDCIYDTKDLDIFYFKAINTILSPFYMIGFVSICFFLYFLIKKIKKSVSIKYYFKTMVFSFIVICDTLYTQILVALLRFFDCTNLDSTNNKFYLRYATNIECFAEEHDSSLNKIAIPGFLIWVAGLPIFFFLILYYTQKANPFEKNTVIKKVTNKNEKKKPIQLFEEDLDSKLTLSFLYQDYKPNRYFWTSVIMIWKTVISVIISFSKSGDVYMQLISFYLFLILIYSWAQPYQHHAPRTLIKISFLTNLFSLILGENIQKDKSYNLEFVILNFAFHIIFFFFVIYYFIIDFDYQTPLEKIITILKKKEKNRFLCSLRIKIQNLQIYINKKQKNDLATPLGSEKRNLVFLDDDNKNVENNEQKDIIVLDIQKKSTLFFF